jgi:hypothetical protein
VTESRFNASRSTFTAPHQHSSGAQQVKGFPHAPQTLVLPPAWLEALFIVVVI